MVFTAFALAADAFAVSLGQGLTWRRFEWRPALLLAGMCGLLQGTMPLLGWALGQTFADAIAAADHWIAFGLLTVIGVKMLWEAWHSRDDETPQAQPRLSLRKVTLLALATSIDALAVGVTFAFLEVNIALAAAVIAFVTFAACLVAVALGLRAGRWLASWAEVAGGLVLIGIGVKILVEHLGG